MPAYSSLRDFIDRLEADGDLVRITEPVSMDREITEIHRRVLHAGGPALLFENVTHADGRPSEMPVLVNLFGTVERVARGVTMGGKERRSGHDLREVGELLAFLKQPEPPRGLREAMDLLPLAKTVLTMKPKGWGGLLGKTAPCQEVVLTGDDVDLDRLPIQTCWPDEAGPLVTWPLIVTRGPSGKREDDYNLGIYRMQKLGKNRLIMRWLKHRGGAQHHQRWKKEKPEPLPAAAVLGADPGTILGAVTPVPDNLSEYHFAGLLRGRQVELVDCRTQPIKVPATAEIVLEGTVSLTEYADEGPYGDHTGYYNSVEPFPVFTVTAITMRQKPIYLSTYTGRPPDEPAILGEALNEVFIPLLQGQFPEIVDFYLPPEGCSYRIAVISMKKAYPGHARRVMMGAWSYLRQFMYTKWVIVVDDDIDCRSWDDVWWAVTTRCDPARDCMMIENTPIDYLDFASPETGLGSKIGIDATNKIGAETKREWGEVLEMDAETVAKVDAMWGRLGLQGRCRPGRRRGDGVPYYITPSEAAKVLRAAERVLVVGCSGGGKTTLALRIAGRFGLEYQSLDRDVRWLPGWQVRDRDEQRAITARLAGRPRWVMDGNSPASFDLRVPRADLVIWVRVPRRVALLRLAWRVSGNFGRVRVAMAAGCPEPLPDREFLSYIWNFERDTAPRIVAQMDVHGPQVPVVILRTQGDFESLLG